MSRMALMSLMIAVMIGGLTMVGCADDLYGECTLEVADCLGGDESRSTSCIEEDQIECQSGACGRYQGSDPFCTMACNDDGDCPSGECREFVFQSGQRHCVANADL